MTKRWTGRQIALYYSPLRSMGGAERQWAKELKALRAAGANVVGITHEASPALLTELSLSGDDVEFLGNQVRWIDRVKALRVWLAQKRPRLLVAHTGPELTYLATRGLVVPYVLYQNSPPFYESSQKNPYPFAFQHLRVFRQLSASTPGYLEFASPPKLSTVDRLKLESRAFLKGRAMRHAAAVVVLSRQASEALRLLYHVNAVVVRGCIDDNLSHYVARFDVRAHHGLGARPLIASICRLDPVKRVDVVIRAFDHVRQVLPQAVLLVGGTGPEESRLKLLAEELSLGDRVVFSGYIDEEVLWDYYAAADVFAAPAMADFNIAPYEALALGRKVVVSTELEIEPWIAASGWAVQAQPTPDGFGQAILDALKETPARPLDLSSLTWSARAGRLIGLFEAAAAAPSRGAAH